MAVTNNHPTSKLTQRIRKLFDLNIVVLQAVVHYASQTGDTQPFAPRVQPVIPSVQKQNSFSSAHGSVFLLHVYFSVMIR
jgi:hypothetical protein